jgi:DNA-binding MarR family transcriptional regulator
MPEHRLSTASGRRSIAGERARSNGHARFDLGVLSGHTGYFVRRFQLWIFQDFIRALADLDIRPAQYSVLVVIETNPGLSQSDIGSLLGIERARLVRLLDRLEQRGFVRRTQSRVDRRSHAIFLTQEGRKNLKVIKHLAARVESRVADRLGPDNRRALIEILREFGEPQQSHV